MTAEQAANPRVDAPATGFKAFWSRGLTWITLFLSAWGALNIFDHLIPGLIRFSIIAKGLTALYRAGRDWVWDQVQWLFAFVHIRIPELPPLWLDGLTIAGLMLAALNFESIRRFGRSVVLDFGRMLWGELSSTFGRKVHGRPTLFEIDDGGLASLAFWLGVFLGFWLFGFALRAGLAALGLEAPIWSLSFISPAWMALLQPALEAAGLGLVLIGLLGALFVASGHFDRAARGPGEAAARCGFLFLLAVPLILGPTFSALFNGWRSIALALALVAALVGANAAAVHVIDPALERPPQWLCALVNGDPQAAPEPRCAVE